MMLFLVIGHPEEDRTLPPRKEFLMIVKKEWETVLHQKELGKVVEVYGFGDRKGGIIIYDVDSREELLLMLASLPMDPYADWEIIPLMSADVGLAKAKRMLEEEEKEG